MKKQSTVTTSVIRNFHNSVVADTVYVYETGKGTPDQFLHGDAFLHIEDGSSIVYFQCRDENGDLVSYMDSHGKTTPISNRAWDRAFLRYCVPDDGNHATVVDGIEVGVPQPTVR